MSEYLILLGLAIFSGGIGYIWGRADGRRQARHGANFIDSMQTAALYMRDGGK